MLRRGALLLALALLALAGDGFPLSTPAPSLAQVAIAQTEAGVAEGLPTFATLGAAGGMLASSDGRLTVNVPAGALSTATQIGDPSSKWSSNAYRPWVNLLKARRSF